LASLERINYTQPLLILLNIFLLFFRVPGPDLPERASGDVRTRSFDPRSMCMLDTSVDDRDIQTQ
jgi:hypothetical protein